MACVLSFSWPMVFATSACADSKRDTTLVARFHGKYAHAEAAHAEVAPAEAAHAEVFANAC